MEHIIVKFEKTSDYLEHFEIMVDTKYGYQPIMTSHPLSGDRPKMFNKKEEAEIFLKKNKSDIKELLKVDLEGYKIIFVLGDNNYNQHFELLVKNLFSWKKIEIFHPMSGDRPMMFDSWGEAKNEIFQQNTINKKFKF